ncbi:glycosyltransferase family 4 protein [Leptolyngbya sp. BC1307]|uniref:glycosyltransferase family 4 protein n=1 Tax=Leptolyngbya sp. BC1307 TaxID=2029589 RepID=UPI000EFC4D79|nr:glycosyltransferase family 4 protein [Leptolyngbya sp. BC1307]
MKISLLSTGITPYVMGGLQRHSFNLVRSLARSGVEVDLYHTDFAEAKHISALDGMTTAEKENVFSIAIPWHRSDHLPGHYIRALKRFSIAAYQQYQKRPAADFVIAKSLTAWAFVKAKRWGTRLPAVGVNLHGFEMFQPSANVRAGLENCLLRPSFYRHAHEADYLFSYGGRITELIQNRLNISEQKIIEIPGGIDASWLVEERKAPIRTVRFVFVGRYERRKGIEELQAAIAANPNWQNYAEFRFIGPIPIDQRLAFPHVSYAGPISDDTLLKHELHQADVLLCPSHSEGMPNVILEGMASGLAVVGTDVGAVRLLVNDKNGVLLPEVSILGIIQAVNHILSLNKAALSAMKQASLEQVQSFTWDRIAAQTLEAIERRVATR